MSQQERREFYRATCEAILEFKAVDKETLATTDPSTLFDQGKALKFLSDYHRLDNKGTALSNNLRSVNANPAQQGMLDYLDVINRKVSCLAESVIAQNPALAGQTSQQVSVSENGFSFQSETTLYKDSLIAVRIVFLPQYLSVVLFAKVVRSEELATNIKTATSGTQNSNRDRFHIALEFINLNDADRQIIAQHVMSTQLKAKRAAKNSSN